MQSQDLKRSNPVYFLYTLMYSPKNTLNFFFIFFPYSENSPKFYFFSFSFLTLQENFVIKPRYYLSLYYVLRAWSWTCMTLQSWHPLTAAGIPVGHPILPKDFSAKFLQTLIGSARALPGLGDEKMQPPVTWQRMKKNEATLRKGIIRAHLPRLGMVKGG